MKLIILGGAKSTRELVPAGDFKLWSIFQNEEWVKSADLWFELHQLDDVPIIKEMVEKRVGSGEEVITQDGVCGSSVYPIDEIIEYTGTRYFTSTFDYMAAYALWYCENIEDIDEIQIIGFNFHGAEEHDRQLPGASYWIGRLEGDGIKVVLQDMSAAKSAYRMYAYGEHSFLDLLNEKKFAIEEEQKKQKKFIEEANAKLAAIQTQIDAMMVYWHKLKGALDTVEDLRVLTIKGGG